MSTDGIATGRQGSDAARTLLARRDPGAADAVRENPLLEQLRERGELKKLASRLRGRRIPDVELTTTDGMHLPLGAHLSGRVVIYFVPGQGAAAWISGVPTRDAAQHRGYLNRRANFEGIRAKVFCVASQPRMELLHLQIYLEARHLMFADPELVLADALELPTSSEEGQPRRHRRVVLIARDGRIETVFGPLIDREAAGSAQHALSWLEATR